MTVNVDVQSLEEEIISFNNWNGAAWLCYNKEKNYFFTEVFANDVQASSTIVMNEEVSVVFSKKEAVKNGNIGENRKAYIIKFVELLHKGYEPHEAEYHLAGEYL